MEDKLSNEPSLNGSIGGRDSQGRFTANNRFGKGNPMSKKVNQLRSAILQRVKTKDMKEVIDELVKKAKSGNIQAISLLCERTIGKVQEPDLFERLERIEEFIDCYEKQFRKNEKRFFK